MIRQSPFDGTTKLHGPSGCSGVEERRRGGQTKRPETIERKQPTVLCECTDLAVALGNDDVDSGC